MEMPFIIYTAIWLALVAVAFMQLIVTRSEQILFKRVYFQFIFQRWKLVTFAISGSGVTFLGPYTIDPTWDWIDGGFMSVLTYITAPWAIGVIWRGLSRKGPKSYIYPAVCVWLFSASWSYDLYLFFRDQFYPATWSSNLVLSSIIYFAAGLFWNLDWKPGAGVIWSFQESGWPQANPQVRFGKIFWVAIPFMLIAMWLTLGFLNVFH